MPKFKSTSMDVSKIEYLISMQKQFAKKTTLLDLFTVCDRPLFTFPNDVVGSDMIEIEVDALHEAMPYLHAKVFHVVGGRDKIVDVIGDSNYAAMESISNFDISDNKDGALMIQHHEGDLILTLIDDTFEFNQGDIGEVQTTEDGDSALYIVNSMRKLRKARDHPYNGIEGGTPPFTYYHVAVLSPYLDGTTVAPHKSYRTYAVYGASIPEGDDPRRGPVRIACIQISKDSTKAPFNIYDKFDLHPGMIPNYSKSEVITTTVGLFLLNASILSNIFGSAIPYVNSDPGTNAFVPGSIDDKVDQLLRSGDASIDQYNEYMKVGYFIGHMSHLFVPGLTVKSLGTDPDIKKKTKELYAKHAHELSDPLVVTKIEKELIAMDRAYMKGDNADRFYAVAAGKSYNEYRKKLFLTVGLAPAFISGTAQYTVTERSLSDGNRPADMVNASNEIRRGVYDRGVSTAKGGEQTKFVLRLFNATVIVMDDCGIRDGNRFTLTKGNIGAYKGRYLVTSQPEPVQLIDDMSDYLGKEVVMRSPQHCVADKGLCYVCCGEAFRSLKVKSIGLSAVQIGSKLMLINMKAMHFSGVSYTTVTDLKPYLLF